MDDETTPAPTTPEVPAGPDYTNADGALTERALKRFGEWERGRENFVHSAYRNILFQRGIQWLVRARNSLTGWRPFRQPGTPTPVTNRFARVMNGFISMLARFEPSLTFAPGSHDAEDRAAADVASRAIEVIEDEVDMTTHRQALAKWVGLTGGAWRETGYDPDPIHGTVEVPMDTCPMCGEEQLPQPGFACTKCGGGPTIPATDPTTGQPKTQTMPRGKLYVAVKSVFEVFFDPSVTEWSKQTAYLVQNAIDVEKAKEKWGGVVDPALIKADSMTGSNQFMESLPTVGPGMDDGARSPLLSGARPTNTKATENYYYELPSEKYPDGLLAIFLGKKPEQFVTAGPLPYYFEDMKGGRTYFLPHVFFPQDEVPGSAWPKTVADDLAPKQVARNKWEAMIEMWGRRMANAVWLNPSGSNIRNVTGDFGQVIEYNPMLPNGHKPERLVGNPVTPGLVDAIARIDQEMDDLAAQYEVLRGDRPAGISAGISLQILKERGEAQYGPMFVKWNHAEAQWAKQALAIAKQFWTEERLRQIKGRDGEWEVQKFLGSDLRSTVDVVPESGITLPRSTMTDRAEMEQLATLGVLNPAADPDDKLEFLKVFGKLHIRKGIEKETRNAIVEDEGFEALAQQPTLAALDVNLLKQQVQMAQAQMVPAPAILAAAERFVGAFGVALPTFRPAIDDHAIHGREHRTFAREQKFRQLPEIVQVLVELHIAAHDFLQGQAMQAMAAARGSANPQAGFLAPPGPRPGSAPSTNPSQGASSPNAMEGQNREMERRQGQPVG